MRERIILPQIHRFHLRGFQPIFKDDIIMNLGYGPNVILGGNGLGKTTIVQAVIYGLTGGNDIIEEDTKLRWNHTSFPKSLQKSAVVEVDLAFDKTNISIRRGFKNSHILAFRIDSTSLGWIENPKEAKDAFAKALKAYGGYRSIEDFAFIVHRLIYLPESRRLLAWDTDSQIRTIMLLNQDIMIEDVFRKRRKDLQLLEDIQMSLLAR